MTQKRSKPGLLTTAVTGLGIGNSSAAHSDLEFSARSDLDQGRFAVAMLARRYGLHPATALANCEAFGWGGRC